MIQNFSSKLLLFGEYSIIKGSKGLAIPFNKFSGKLVKAKNADDIKESLKLDDLFNFVKGSGILSRVLDMKSFEADIKDGLFFDSNIPLGHGVGSSGALCASLYYRYAYDFERKTKFKKDELKCLQDFMALMESYYHGSSSGLDCLISLINRPILIESRNNLKEIDVPDLDYFGHFYLYETNIIRKTGPLVHEFLSDYENNQDFRQGFEEFMKLTNITIDSLVGKKKEEFINGFNQISRNQYLHFSKMIPGGIKEFWLEGLEKKDFFIKLCGAGGGGFFLVYSPYEKLNQPNLIEIR
jgi:mevalonate kinase